MSLNGSQARRAYFIFYFSVLPQYLFSEFTKDLTAARKDFYEACDVESDSEKIIIINCLQSAEERKKQEIKLKL